MIQITKQYQRTVDFSDLIANENCIDGPIDLALRNLSNEVDVKEWLGMGGEVAVLVGESEQEVDEKVQDLISNFEVMSHCVKFLPEEHNHGVDFSYYQEYASNQVRNIVWWGGTSNLTTLTDVVAHSFPNNLIVLEEHSQELDEPMVYFFWDKSVHLNDRGEIEEVYQEDYPLNEKAKALGIEYDCYGEIIQLPLSIAQKYFDIKEEDEE